MKFVPVLLTAAMLTFGTVKSSEAWAERPMSAENQSRIEALRRLEQQMQDAISRRDYVFLDRFTDPTFIRIDEHGKVEDRATVRALIRKPPPTSDIIRRTIDPMTHQVYLHGKVAITRGDLEVRGPKRAFRTTYTSAYGWRGGGWKLLSSTTISLKPLAP